MPSNSLTNWTFWCRGHSKHQLPIKLSQVPQVQFRYSVVSHLNFDLECVFQWEGKEGVLSLLVNCCQAWTWFHSCSASALLLGLPGGSAGKESTCSAGDLDSIPGLGRSPGGGHGNLLQYSCLENPHGQRSLAGCSPWGHKELDTTERLSAQHSAIYWITGIMPAVPRPGCHMPWNPGPLISLFIQSVYCLGVLAWILKSIPTANYRCLFWGFQNWVMLLVWA